MGDAPQRTPPPSLDVPAAYEECFRCGVPFAVPRGYRVQRLKDGRTFWCPNGHGQAYERPAKPNVEQRRELVAALHRAEQAEARASTAESRAGSATQGAVPAAAQSPAPTGPADVVTVTIPADQHGRPTCPECGRSFALLGASLRHHLRRKHGIVAGALHFAGKGAGHG